eukprot:TRINITY_DN10759_c0_g1_i1.p1 TRINITY_DN10759_c0_g1~~TRINITY_DN10759_c0_g1_i1.p1  ORF type:complete len:288 (-),score=32.07 TRINITY_DN10759_c0_g1_i1:184-1047(-)
MGAQVSVTCWYCNNDQKINKEDRNGWLCSTCEQFNSFTQNGSYSLKYWKHYEASSTHQADKELYSKKHPVLCDYCICNQEKMIAARRDYEGTVEQWNKLMEVQYVLCDQCKSNYEGYTHDLHKNFISMRKVYDDTIPEYLSRPQIMKHRFLSALRILVHFFISLLLLIFCVSFLFLYQNLSWVYAFGSFGSILYIGMLLLDLYYLYYNETSKMLYRRIIKDTYPSPTFLTAMHFFPSLLCWLLPRVLELYEEARCSWCMIGIIWDIVFSVILRNRQRNILLKEQTSM